jgi:hypothetical protein
MNHESEVGGRLYRRLGVSPCRLHNRIPRGPSNIETNTTFENEMRVASDSVEDPMVEALIERLSWDMNILLTYRKVDVRKHDCTAKSDHASI